jgi:hypothetical protein
VVQNILQAKQALNLKVPVKWAQILVTVSVENRSSIAQP